MKGTFLDHKKVYTCTIHRSSFLKINNHRNHNFSPKNDYEQRFNITGLKLIKVFQDVPRYFLSSFLIVKSVFQIAFFNIYIFLSLEAFYNHPKNYIKIMEKSLRLMSYL